LDKRIGHLCIFTGLQSLFSLLCIPVAEVAVLLFLVGCVHALDRTLMLSNERSSIERTYELTKYLDHQLKEIRDTYVSHNLCVCVFYQCVAMNDVFVYRCFPVDALTLFLSILPLLDCSFIISCF